MNKESAQKKPMIFLQNNRFFTKEPASTTLSKDKEMKLNLDYEDPGSYQTACSI